MTRHSPFYSRSHALIVGINTYAHASPLGYAVSDAEAFAEALRSQFAFAPDDMTILLDANATRGRIQQAFLRFVREATDVDDRLIMFFAGHGHTELSRRGDVGYLVPYDGHCDDLSTLLRWDVLTRDADLIRAKHVLFIMDACYGGLAVTRATQPGATRFLKDMLQRPARQVLTAGKANEVVADLGGPRPNHSVFTGHLLDALDGAATSEGLITANGVMAYVYARVSTDDTSQQTPHYGYLQGDGDLIFNPPPPGTIDTDLARDEDILVSVVGDLVSNGPPSFASMCESTKTLVAKQEDRIRLHDHIAKETRRVLSSLSGDTFSVHGNFSADELAGRVDAYNQLTLGLCASEMLLGFWGDAVHGETILLPAKRIAGQIALVSGLSAWLGLRWYPVLMLAYCCGLGAVSAERYSNFRAFLQAKIPDHRTKSATTTVVQGMYQDFAGIADVFKTLPGHERQYVPVSEFIFKHLQPVADDVLFVGADYDRLFDRVELLIALECASLDGGWGPIGRFGWKHRSRGRVDSPLEALIAEAEAAGDTWGPIKGGFFAGSFSTFQQTVQQFKPTVDSLGWF